MIINPLLYRVIACYNSNLRYNASKSLWIKNCILFTQQKTEKTSIVIFLIATERLKNK